MDRNEVVRLNEQVVDLATLESRLAALKQADPNVAVVIQSGPAICRCKNSLV